MLELSRMWGVFTTVLDGLENREKRGLGWKASLLMLIIIILSIAVEFGHSEFYSGLRGSMSTPALKTSIKN